MQLRQEKGTDDQKDFFHQQQHIAGKKKLQNLKYYKLLRLLNATKQTAISLQQSS
jgi:hypothetical protein